MSRIFVMEAVMLAIHGQLLKPGYPVEYILPYTSIMELYEMKDGLEPIMPTEDDDVHVKKKIGELIAYFEDSFNRKKIEKALQMAWRKSPPLPVDEDVTITVLYAVENAEYGEEFDPIETELILAAIREKSPLLTDQLDFMEKLIEAQIPIEIYDVEDFEFAVEGDFLL
ncbi:ADP-heptose synthase [Paenibacillus eucommiae]|uniref:ADP-heptose synthase n=1 Tax=Paenibacillus eucommiae TaxID=1355755 RepID=A0ABS4IUI9_9BACL|nr:ADP-heptose synthase [Paenibacillus eucommiae]MBP1991242.1 hypothetical protein [Paenibacillus eucommiae]